MSKLWKYPDEVADFIRDNVQGRTTRELTALLNEKYSKKFDIVFTEARIHGYKTNHKLKSGTPAGCPRGYSTKYPEGMEKYIKSIAAGRSNEEIAKMTAEHFGIEFSARQCKSFKKNHDITSGLTGGFEKGHVPANKGKSQPVTGRMAETQFKKGDIPHNHMEVGEYTHTTDGYLIRKVKEKGTQWERFEFVHRATWEKYNGPIPEGKTVSFLNGNKDDCDIDNLILIDNAINLEMNRKKLRTQDRELTKIGSNIAKLSITTSQKKKKLKKRRPTS